MAEYVNFPGPKYLGPELQRLYLTNDASETRFTVDRELAFCTNCKRCDAACPHGVTPASFNLRNRAYLKLPLKVRIRDWVLAHNYYWGRAGKRFAPLVNLLLKQRWIRLSLALIGVTPHRPLPLYDRRKIVVANTKAPGVPSSKKALYFAGCYATFFDTEVAKSTINLLHFLGYEVKLAPLFCCGTPLVSNGLLKQAYKVAEKNTRILLNYVAQGYKIVTSCPSCSLALKQEFEDILGLEGARELALSVWDICELLEEEGVEPSRTEPTKTKLYYHLPCHLKAQGVGAPAVRILENWYDIILNDELCCGLAGTFGYKKEKYALSMAIGRRLFTAIKNSECSVVVTDCGMCKVQIQHGTGIEVVHPAQLIEANIVRS